MEEEDGSLADDPVYRAGKLMGRNQCVTEIMEFVLDPGGGKPEDRIMKIMEWGAQTLAEGHTELEMVVAELRAAEEDD